MGAVEQHVTGHRVNVSAFFTVPLEMGKSGKVPLFSLLPGEIMFPRACQITVLEGSLTSAHLPPSDMMSSTRLPPQAVTIFRDLYDTTILTPFKLLLDVSRTSFCSLSQT